MPMQDASASPVGRSLKIRPNFKIFRFLRRTSAPNLFLGTDVRHVSRYLEGELQLISDNPPASIRIRCVRLKEPSGWTVDISRDGTGTVRIARWRKWTDACLPVLRMVENIIELGTKLDGFGF